MAASSQALLAAVYEILTDEQDAGTFYSDLGGRIYTVEAPHGTLLPHAVIQPFNQETSQFFGGWTDKRLRVAISIFAPRTTGLDSVSDTMRKAYVILQNYTTAMDSPGGHDRLVVTCESEWSATMDEEAVVVQSVWLLMATER